MPIAFLDWIRGISEQYGVDPLIFALIYVLTIPGFTISIGWIVRRMLLGKSFALPVISATVFYLAAYIYLFAAGRNIPLWFYLVVIAIILISGGFTIQNVLKRAARIKPQDTTHDLIVIGGGAGGLAAAEIASRLGAKTLVIEKHRLGGDFTWGADLPSKTLLRAARAAADIRDASRYGLTDRPVSVNFSRVMEHVRQTCKNVYESSHRPEVLRGRGVEVCHGRACFLDKNTVEIETADDEIITATGRYLVIAAGASPAVPDIPGIDDVEYITSRTLFDLEDQPEHLLILGGGAIGIEMAQAFRALGTEVTLIEQEDRILPMQDRELALLLQDRLEDDGIQLYLNANVSRAAQPDDATINLQVNADGEQHTVSGDALLLATGRKPNLEGLRLEAAGVEYTDTGITVNKYCRTNQRPILAVGDITGRYYFTHMSEHMGRIAAINALIKIPTRIDDTHVPRVTYTSPELAEVGHSEKELEELGIDYETYEFPFERVDRATTEAATFGRIKIFATKWRGQILGSAILGDRAGELIGEVALAMRQDLPLRKIAETIHPYPTYGSGLRHAADQWYMRKQTPKMVQLIKKIFGYRGSPHTTFTTLEHPEDDFTPS